MVNTRRLNYSSTIRPVNLSRRERNEVSGSTSTGDRTTTDNNDGNGSVDTVTVSAPISHLVLKLVDYGAVSKLIRDWERYERQINEKQFELPTLTAAK